MSINPYDTRTAAADKCSTEMLVEIIRDLQQHNYGIAETAAKVLLCRVEREAQEQRATTARQRNAEATEAAKKEPDAFLEAITWRIGNIAKVTRVHGETPHTTGLRGGFQCAAAIYKECKEDGTI